MVARLFDAGFVTVGNYLDGTDLLEVSLGGARALVRPRTEDLGLLALTQEPNVAAWFHPREGETVIDVGANVGGYTVRAAHAGARVLSLEPNPQTFAVLQKCVGLNGWTNVELRQIAAGRVGGASTLYLPEVFSGRASLVHDFKSHSVQVNVDSLDNVVKSSGLTRVDWLKIDVEGSEIDVLEGARATLRRTKRIIIEVEPVNEVLAKRILTEETGFVILHRDAQPEVTYWYLERPAQLTDLECWVRTQEDEPPLGTMPRK